MIKVFQYKKIFFFIGRSSSQLSTQSELDASIQIERLIHLSRYPRTNWKTC
ncbi:hypothetical protein pah_c002o001 [Parachlamydia acanthamoebae str. Hall's coccus]|nr:hypothetical protein pah_c002o001 [Parachlamydia acanthamoebae str. Hall's coccus]